MADYVKTNWEDNKTPVNAKNLNNIEDGVKKNEQDIDAVEESVAKAKAAADQAQKEVDAVEERMDEAESKINDKGKWTILCDTDPTAESTNMIVETWDIDIDNFTELMVRLYVPQDSDTTARSFQVVLIDNENNIPALFPDSRVGNLFVAQSTSSGKADPTRDVAYLFESRFFTNGDLIKTEMSWSGYSAAAYPQGDYSAITYLSEDEGAFSTSCNLQGKRGIAIKYVPNTCSFPAGTVLRVYGR